MSLQFLQPYFGLGNGLQTKNVAGGGAGVGGWVELGRTTLGSPTPSITVSSLADKRYYMILTYGIDNGGVQLGTQIRFNGDTGTSYSGRRSPNGVADGTDTNQSQLYETDAWGVTPQFQVTYISNFSTKEKLILAHHVKQQPVGSANVPQRNEMVGKWTNTASSISSTTQTNWTGGSNYGTNSETVVLGWDPADTHSNNFWTELASVNGSGGAAVLSSGTFTAKKYLWVQAYCVKTTSAGTDDVVTLGNATLDTGNNYAYRRSLDGAGDTTTASVGYIGNTGGSASGTQFLTNMFIVNSATREKLVIGHTIINTNGSGTAPQRSEFIGKWVNTTNQANIVGVGYAPTPNTYSTSSILKVWGAN